MHDVLLRVLILASVGLTVVLLVRHPARRLFGAGPAFTLWLLPWLMVAAAWLPLPYHAVTPTFITTVLAAPSHAAYVVSADAVVRVAPARWPLYAAIAIWLIGALCSLTRLAMQTVRLWRDVQPLPETLRERLRPLCSPAELRRLRLHPRGPAVAWALRTRVLLPADFMERFNAGACRVILRHELTHARRGDAWWTLAAELSRAVLWFHPLAWWASSRFRLDMELACDECTLRASPGCHADYGRALLDSSATRPAAALIPWLTAPQLKARITMLARLPPGRWRRGVGVTSVAALLAAGLLGSSAVMGTPTGGLAAPNTVNAAQATSVAATPTTGTAKNTPPSTGHIDFRRLHPPTVYIYPPTGRVRLLQMHPPVATNPYEHGMVVVDVTVDATGRVTDVAIDQPATTAPNDLQKSTLRAARKWKLALSKVNGKAIGGTVRIPVKFVAAASGPTGGRPAIATSSAPHIIVLLPARPGSANH